MAEKQEADKRVKRAGIGGGEGGEFRMGSIYTLLRLAFAIGGIAFLPSSFGQTITGRVVGVSDGDSLTHAPEGGQEFSQNAKEGLSRLVFGRDVSLRMQDSGENASAWFVLDRAPLAFGAGRGCSAELSDQE